MGRVRRDYLVITFDTTTAAMACEKLCHSKGLPGRMIPVPSQISAGCGLSWRVLPGEKDALLAALDDAGIPWAAADVVQLWELVRDPALSTWTTRPPASCDRNASWTPCAVP